MASTRIHPVETPAQLEALVSPVRQDIVDTVAAYGECAIADMARELGRPADGLYYHVRALLKVGLLEESGSRSGARREHALYRIPGGARQLRIRYRPRQSRHRRSLERTIRAALRAAERDFADALGSTGAVVDGRYRNLWGGRRKGWLSHGEVAEVNALLERLLELLSRPRTASRDRLYSLSYVFAPVEARRARRS